MQVMDKLQELEARPAGSLSDVVVIGGGYAGVELSAVVAEKLGDKGRVKVSWHATHALFAYLYCTSPAANHHQMMTFDCGRRAFQLFLLQPH
jgi:hypothetical protein